MSSDLLNIMQSFVFADCRLGSHPKVRASLYWIKDGRPMLFGRTQATKGNPQFSQQPDHDVMFSLTQGGYGTAAYYEQDSQKAFYWIILPISAGNNNGVLALESLSTDLVDERNLGVAQLLASLVGYIRCYDESRPNTITPISVSLGTAMAQARKEMGLSQALLASKIGTSRIAISRWERGAQPPSLGPLFKWCEDLDLFSSEAPTIVKVSEITPWLLDILRENPSNLSQLSPEAFEHFIADRLDNMGFHVHLTGATRQRDGGIDLIAVPKVPSASAFLLAGQVKEGVKKGSSLLLTHITFSNIVSSCLGLFGSNSPMPGIMS